MSVAPQSLDDASAGSSSTRSVALTVAGAASVGAGAIHAGAIGGHSGLTEVVVVFTIAAVFQLAWGAVALAQGRRTPVVLGALVNGCLVGGWVLAKTGGIGFVEGMEEAQSPSFPDSAAAALALVAAAGAVASMARPGLGRRFGTMTSALSGVVVLVVGALGMSAAASPDHHGSGAAGATSVEAQVAAAVARPYDPALPIDLGGIDGVTPAQQAAAENLISNTLSHLPQYADPTVAEAAGYATIHDGSTGYEHFINAAYQGDGRVLDPDRPESLVYQIIDGERTLVAAMYMAEPGTTLETVPELGGPLTQWHVHGDLCFTPPPNSRVAGLTDSNGECAPGLLKPEPVPMIHVWIRPHPCGPFAALEGIGGGQIPEGETRLCDTAHGGH